MGQTYSWAALRERAAREFGNSFPNAVVETELREVFAERPVFVIAAVDEVALAYKAGRVHSPWAFLRKRVSVDNEQPDLVVTDETERQAALARARAWVRNAGHHFDSQLELEHELFERGGLRAWADDPGVRAEMVSVWRKLQPAGAEAPTDWDGEEPPLRSSSA